jgi:glycosyltransferase involved in cell wall biosynthesis
MRVSFVIPTLNQAPFIRRCIDGCLAQGIEDAEVLVMDAGSTDGTLDVLRSYGERVRWVSEPDEGQSDAVNKGVSRATGEVIAWINSDDYYASPAVLRRALEVFTSERETDIVYGDGLLVDAEGNPVQPFPGRALRSPKEILILPSSFVLQPAVFFRRQLFLDAGGLDKSLHWSMDYDLWCRLFPRARAARYVHEVFACATVHPGAKSIRGMREQIAETAAIKRRYAGAFGLTAGERLRMRAGLASLRLYWLLSRTGVLPLVRRPMSALRRAVFG